MEIDDINKELEELFKDPILKITDEEKALFTLPEVLKAKKERKEADYVAQRIICENFADYESGFKQVHKDLREGKRMLKRYTGESAIQAGKYYVLNGVVVYLDQLIEMRKENRTGGHLDGRTRLIYENGTESDIKFRTLGKSIQIDGFIITESTETDEVALEVRFNNIESSDIADGYIYVLSSLSTDPHIQGQKDLYKIGFSTTRVEERIKNCEYEPTYLMDQVKIVSVWKTFNLQTNVFENIIHQFFKSVQFKVKVRDIAGNESIPQEWFVVPLGIIERVVEMIIDGSVVDYRYNPTMQVLEKVEKEKRTASDKVDTTGWSILTLRIKQIYFDLILKGEKTVEYRDMKQSQIGKYTWVEQDTGTRYLRKFDALRLFVRNTAGGGDRMLVEVIDTQYNPDSRQVEYLLGKVLEVDIKSNLHK